MYKEIKEIIINELKFLDVNKKKEKILNYIDLKTEHYGKDTEDLFAKSGGLTKTEYKEILLKNNINRIEINNTTHSDRKDIGHVTIETESGSIEFRSNSLNEMLTQLNIVGGE